MNTENRNPTIVPDINKRVITITDLSQDQDLEKCPSLRVTAGYRACDSLKQQLEQLETTAGEAGVDLEIKVNTRSPPRRLHPTEIF